MTDEQPRSNALTAFAVVVALGIVGVLAYLVSMVGDDDDTVALAAGEVSWLYSQTADGAELDDLGGGAYRLIMRGVDPHTIQFSDRPDRLVEIIDTARLVHHWPELFADSAPNAVLVEHEPSGETDSLVVVLTDPIYDMAARTLSYGVEILADELHPERLVALADGHTRPPTMMRWVSLFIDSVQDLSGGAGIDPSTIAGPAAQQLIDTFAGGDLGGGVHLESANVTLDPATGTISGVGVISFDTAGFRLAVDIAVTDAQNWSLTTSVMTASTWTPANLPSLTIDPSTLSGTISMTGGEVAYDIVGTTHTWAIATGVTYVSTPEIASDCPLDESQCPTGVDGPYLSMNGTLSIAGFGSDIALSGAATTDGNWARFDGSAGNIDLAGYGIKDAALTIWHGQRSDSYDANLQLPSLATLNNGLDLELCGGFTIPIPGHSSHATDGCARWSTAGIVIGQIGLGITMDGEIAASGGDQTATSEVKGLAWTNIGADVLGQLPSADTIMDGVHDALASNTITLSGTASLPGVAADALNIDLRGAENFVFDVTGEVSLNSFTLSAVLPTNIRIASGAFQTTITSVTATIAAERGGGASFSIGTTGAATIGYSPNTRQITTSVQLVASTGTSTGMAISVNAVGSKAAGDSGGDGLTAATRLAKPSQAQYVWPDQFGIGGMNLWSFTVQIAYEDGSPALGYTSTTYLDPNGSTTGSVIACDATCDDADWLVGNLGLNISYTNPCFAYSFTSGSGTSGLAIDGGTITAESFKVGIAPAGCSIQSGSTQQSLPVGFAGFQFDATFGSATLEVATQISADGFVFQESLDNLTLAGMDYETIALSITITDAGSDMSFTADMSSGMGDMAVTSEFSSTSSSTTQSLDATLTDWDWAGGDIDIERLHFSDSATIPTTASGCASFEAAAGGSVTLAGSTVTLEEGSSISIDCDGVDSLAFDLTYSHTASGGGELTEEIVMEYPTVIGGTTYFYGETEFSYKKHFSKKYKSRTFSKNVTITIGMSVTVNPTTPSASGFEFWGDFDADRVSGDVDCELPPGSSDFSCSGKLRLNPSWAGVYHHTWSGL